MLSQRYFEWQEGHFIGHPDISIQRDISSGTSLKPIIVSTYFINKNHKNKLQDLDENFNNQEDYINSKFVLKDIL